MFAVHQTLFLASLFLIRVNHLMTLLSRLRSDVLHHDLVGLVVASVVLLVLGEELLKVIIIDLQLMVLVQVGQAAALGVEYAHVHLLDRLILV